MPLSNIFANVGKFLEGDVGKSILAGIQAASQARPQGQFIDLGHGYRAWREPGRGESLSNMMGAFSGTGAQTMGRLQEEDEARRRALKEKAAALGIPLSESDNYGALLEELAGKVGAEKRSARVLPLQTTLAELGQIPAGEDQAALFAQLAKAIPAVQETADARKLTLLERELGLRGGAEVETGRKLSETADEFARRRESRAAQSQLDLETRTVQRQKETWAKQNVDRMLETFGAKQANDEAYLQRRREEAAKAGIRLSPNATVEEINEAVTLAAQEYNAKIAALEEKIARLQNALGIATVDPMGRILGIGAAEGAK